MTDKSSLKRTDDAELRRVVRELRLAMGHTQQSFANFLGLSIATVVRYEISRAPKGRALAKLAKVAEEAGLHDIARRLHEALAEQLGRPDLGWQITPHPRNASEATWVIALLHALRDPKHAPVLPKLARLLRKPLEDAVAQGLANKTALEEFRRLLEQAQRAEQ